MVNVMLKPCQVEVNKDFVFIYLNNRCFTVEINDKKYEFIPKKEKKVVVNRNTGKIVNTDALLTFEKENTLVYITMSQLILMPEFLIEIYYIAHPYYTVKDKESLADETEVMMKRLEQQNVKRLIDHALDERDEERFYELVNYLK